MKKTNIIKSPLRALFIDLPGGCLLPQAIELSKHFEKLYYNIQYVNSFALPYNDSIGTGYEEITVLNDIFTNVSLYDIVITGDLNLQPIVSLLKKLGKLTFGSTLDQLENHRDQFYQKQEMLGMDVAPYEVVKGFTAFRELITKNKDAGYCKVNVYRGVCETFRYEGINHTEPMLDKIEYELGPLAEDMVFIVQAPIDGNVIELGCDTFVVEGNHPESSLVGVEAKDSAYLGKFVAMKSAPKQIEKINQAFKPILQAWHATNFMSTEIRCDLDNNKTYYTDLTGRMPQPASNVMLKMYTNIGDILVKGAQGTLVEPICSDKYGVEVLLKSNWSSTDFLSVSFPEEYTEFIKLKGSFIRDGQHYVVPFRKTGIDLNCFGSVVVTGKNLDEIMDKAIEIAGTVEGFDVVFESDVLEKIKSELDNLEKKTGYIF